MRRMREFSFGHYAAMAVPVLGAAFGIQFYLRHHHAGPATAQISAVKPSSSHEKATGKGARKIASQGDKDGDRIPNRRRQAEQEEDASFAEVGAVSGDKSSRSVAADSHASQDSSAPSAALEGAANDAASAGRDCTPLEYRGAGPDLTQVTKADWTVVMDQFHGAKTELLGWLSKHRQDFNETTASAMERQVKNLKIQRPPAADEPDLSWRGVGIYSQSNETEPMIKMGGGFVNFAIKHPARAKFEMARLVAQSWAPCELARVVGNGATIAANNTWAPVLKCLGVNESQSCAQGSFSESGWAVSSTVAAAVSPPSCQIPAFHNPEFAKCVGKVGRTVASASAAVVEEHK